MGRWTARPLDSTSPQILPVIGSICIRTEYCTQQNEVVACECGSIWPLEGRVSRVVRASHVHVEYSVRQRRLPFYPTFAALDERHDRSLIEVQTTGFHGARPPGCGNLDSSGLGQRTTPGSTPYSVPPRLLRSDTGNSSRIQKFRSVSLEMSAPMEGFRQGDRDCLAP